MSHATSPRARNLNKHIAAEPPRFAERFDWKGLQCLWSSQFQPHIPWPEIFHGDGVGLLLTKSLTLAGTKIKEGGAPERPAFLWTLARGLMHNDQEPTMWPLPASYLSAAGP